MAYLPLDSPYLLADQYVAGRAASRLPPDLAFLYTPKLQSRFSGVYPRSTRGSMAKLFWRSKTMGVDLGCYATQVDAATAVANFWRNLYGDEWRHFFRCRFDPAWHIIRVRPSELQDGKLVAARRLKNGKAATNPKAWECGPADGQAVRVFVYEWGRKKFLPPPHPKADVFACEDDASVFFRQWAYQRYGIFQQLAIRRAELG